MPKQLPVPPELQHLIEKRSGEDRRGGKSAPPAAEKPADRRKRTGRRKADR